MVYFIHRLNFKLRLRFGFVCHFMAHLQMCVNLSAYVLICWHRCVFKISSVDNVWQWIQNRRKGKKTRQFYWRHCAVRNEQTNPLILIFYAQIPQMALHSNNGKCILSTLETLSVVMWSATTENSKDWQMLSLHFFFFAPFFLAVPFFPQSPTLITAWLYHIYIERVQWVIVQVYGIIILILWLHLVFLFVSTKLRTLICYLGDDIESSFWRWTSMIKPQANTYCLIFYSSWW